MPIISFTPKDKMAAVTLEAGYQTVTVEEIDGPKGSKSGQSINWFTRFIVSGGDPVWIILNGREPGRILSQDGDYV